jgi:hypothetical protein
VRFRFGCGYAAFVIFCELSVLRFNFASLREFFSSSFLVRFAPFRGYSGSSLAYRRALLVPSSSVLKRPVLPLDLNMVFLGVSFA